MNDYPQRPRKRFGQNFLHDRSAIKRIVSALEPGADERVLEIGPGRGALTRALLDRGVRVVAVEIDRDLAAQLRTEFSGAALEVLEEDILKLGAAATPLRDGPWVIAGNLPYNISKPVIMKLVEWAGVVDRAVLMFQREVADRLLGRPGSSAYGPLSVLPSELYSIERLFDLAPSSFRPRPRVHSTVTLWRKRENPPSAPDLRRLRTTLRVVFGNRRKTLRNNLRHTFRSPEAADRLLADAGIDGQRRAETLEREELHRLARSWPAPD